MRRFRLRGDRGSAAVEFALVLPVLVVIVLGMIDFSRIYFAQVSLANAAREGARTLVIKNDAAQATTNAQAAASPLAPISVAFTPSVCSANTSVSAVATYQITVFGPFFPSQTVTLSGRSAMQCGG